jgi:hypothetical protein
VGKQLSARGRAGAVCLNAAGANGDTRRSIRLRCRHPFSQHQRADDMSRVLLFVQDAGWAQPVCIRHGHKSYDPIADGLWLTRLTYDADRWWLVECDSATEGREAIAELNYFGGDQTRVTFGRILASGDRKVDR